MGYKRNKVMFVRSQGHNKIMSFPQEGRDIKKKEKKENSLVCEGGIKELKSCL